jgi:hypothetical protein
VIADVSWRGAPPEIRRRLDLYREVIETFAAEGGKTADQVIRLMAALACCDETTIRRTVKWTEADHDLAE